MNFTVRFYLQIIKRARQKYLLEDYAKKDQPLSKILSDVDAALVVSIQISRNFGFIIKICVTSYNCYL